MESHYPSIFNDVIGPIMRGPSSSHCAAALRIGRLARDFMGGEVEEVLIEFDPNGSLVTTHESQGSDMGLFGGLLGWEADDDRLVAAAHSIQKAGIKSQIKIVDYGAQHPNTYRITLRNRTQSHQLIALSTGGGMVEIIEIDGVPLSIAGDYFETLIYIDANEAEVIRQIEENFSTDEIRLCRGKDTTFIEVKAQNYLSDDFCRAIDSKPEVLGVKKLAPVLPVLSRRGVSVPYLTCEEMLEYNDRKNLDLWELAVIYESSRAGISEGHVWEKIANILRIMQNSITIGIAGTEFTDRILGCQSGDFKTQMEAHKLLDGGMLNRMVLYATAMMEVKSAMGVIVAAPTAGSCGVLPGACIGAAEFLDLGEKEIAKGLLAAGLVGIFIAARSTFAAEEAGCQAECGAASGMASAALVTLAKGNLPQAIGAASMALQNIFGLVCDPVANRVEVPCLGKNVLAVSNALSSANMALAGFDQVIPLDEVIAAMDAVGRSIPCALRCTALGGLSVTPASKEMEHKLKVSG
ncbi:MAG: L-serine ammonia-lyase, iron-sulfur-dependent, subunit alpha [Desulfobacteraceae bacterium]|jgi:L-serine dehydratase|nr:L-serine ammonia-lyase, iron-sulfur-dependent, subunit alpha [Desulfobacteraceae bacterium]